LGWAGGELIAGDAHWAQQGLESETLEELVGRGRRRGRAPCRRGCEL